MRYAVEGLNKVQERMNRNMYKDFCIREHKQTRTLVADKGEGLGVVL